MNALTAPLAPSLVDLFNDGRVIRNDITSEVYHADRSCVSVSGLKHILRSPAHFRAYLDGERKETPALFFGSAIHTKLLEPDVFDAEYVVAPVGDKRRTEYKEFLVANANKKIITIEQKAQIEGMERAVRAHASFNAVLQAGIMEHTIIWQDANTGIWLKMRPDCLCPFFGDGTCVDVKSTEDASARGFARSCVDYDYDLQSAVYLDGLRVVFDRDFDFCFGAVEKSEPFGVALYAAPAEMLDRGKRRFRQAMSILARCRETNEWPAYQPLGDYELLEWPRWAT